ncbi:MAG: CotS family spore coat protein [Thermoflexaceae bacterium]|nr:CotS family spore coat protein [Thermoflexaceae bacterium]
MGIFEQFGLSVYRTVRGRGAYICETNQGIKLLRETTCKEEKYAKEDYITSKLTENGFHTVDIFERTVNGNLLAEDEDKKKYYLKKWFDAGECDVKNYNDVLNACGGIARAHVCLNKFRLEPESLSFQIPASVNLKEKYEKKIKEMRSVSNYLRKKKGKSDFERMAFEKMDVFLKEALNTMEYLEQSDYMPVYEQAMKTGTLSHGSCNHHNILNGKGYVAVVNFERANINVQIVDLYDFMRKILEKYNWDIKLAYRMMDEYNRVKTITDEDLIVLSLLFSFPEKYFKIMDHYFNSSKAWIPDKDIEKLNVVVKQNEARLRFVESLK